MIFFFFSIDAKIKIKKNPAARTCHGHSRTEINTVPHEHKTPVIDSHTAALVVSRARPSAGGENSSASGPPGAGTNPCVRAPSESGRRPPATGGEGGRCRCMHEPGRSVPGRVQCTSRLPRARSPDLDVSLSPVRPPLIWLWARGRELLPWKSRGCTPFPNETSSKCW